MAKKAFQNVKVLGLKAFECFISMFFGQRKFLPRAGYS